ncbi:MAG TPA: hypothetical protein VK187_01850, partial [Geobacteraceae bacterium]|nr:hypothetical protein [Geobacteraceae bacterium]
PGFDPNVNAGVNILAPFGIWDLGVFTDPAGDAGLLRPKYSVITGINTTPDAFNRPQMALPSEHNVLADPQMVNTYRNTISATQGGAALGNFVSFTYSPLFLTGNYHIKGTSPARGVGITGAPVFSWNAAFLDFDFDGDSRAAPVDIGADQVNSKGDLNGDGVVTVNDAILALRLVAGLTPPPVSAEVLNNVHVAPLSPTGRPAAGSASYNPPATNTVTVADALLILQRAIGLIFW